MCCNATRRVVRHALRLEASHPLPWPAAGNPQWFGNIELSHQASNLALIVNELILNSLEHAFQQQKTGLIGLDIRRGEQAYFLDLYDNGSGIPEDFDVSQAKSLGLQIVRTLIVDDMGGTFALVKDHGTHARITIPRTLEEEAEK